MITLLRLCFGFFAIATLPLFLGIIAYGEYLKFKSQGHFQIAHDMPVLFFSAIAAAHVAFWITLLDLYLNDEPRRLKPRLLILILGLSLLGVSIYWIRQFLRFAHSIPPAQPLQVNLSATRFREEPEERNPFASPGS